MCDSVMRLASSSPHSPIFTYRLGQALYIPVTSICNTVSLPKSRGPSFHLPPHVLEALENVRFAENATNCKPTCSSTTVTTTSYKKNSLYKIDFLQSMFQKNDAPFWNLQEDGRFPSISTLFKQIETQLLFNTDTATPTIHSIVFGGEGEPILRLPAITSISRRIRNRRFDLPIRVMTNGLTQTMPNYIGVQIVQVLKESGVSHLSVSLPTACPNQYIQIMEPMVFGIDDDQNQCNKLCLNHVCNFIQQAIQQGMNVEITSVDRPDVNKNQVEELARSLGVVTEVRWRSFHP